MKLIRTMDLPIITFYGPLCVTESDHYNLRRFLSFSQSTDFLGSLPPYDVASVATEVTLSELFKMSPNRNFCEKLIWGGIFQRVD